MNEVLERTESGPVAEAAPSAWTGERRERMERAAAEILAVAREGVTTVAFRLDGLYVGRAAVKLQLARAVLEQVYELPGDDVLPFLVDAGISLILDTAEAQLGSFEIPEIDDAELNQAAIQRGLALLREGVPAQAVVDQVDPRAETGPEPDADRENPPLELWSNPAPPTDSGPLAP